MGLFAEYYEALGAIITRYEATLTCFMADGLMLLPQRAGAVPRSRAARRAYGARHAGGSTGAERRLAGTRYSIASALAWPRGRRRWAASAMRAAPIHRHR